MKWKLNTQHYIDDALLDPGTIVGTDTPYPFPYPPSLNMEPVDEEAKAYLKAHPRKFGDEGRPEVPTELLLHPTGVSPGQRVGGAGPKPDATKAEIVPGQGPQAGAAELVNQRLMEKVTFGDKT